MTHFMFISYVVVYAVTINYVILFFSLGMGSYASGNEQTTQSSYYERGRKTFGKGSREQKQHSKSPGFSMKHDEFKDPDPG